MTSPNQRRPEHIVSRDTTIDPTVNVGEIDSAGIDYLWEGRIPRGLITVVAGMPGQGKSLFAYFLASEISRRKKGVIYVRRKRTRRRPSVRAWTPLARCSTTARSGTGRKLPSPAMPIDCTRRSERTRSISSSSTR